MAGKYASSLILIEVKEDEAINRLGVRVNAANGNCGTGCIGG